MSSAEYSFLMLPKTAAYSIKDYFDPATKFGNVGALLTSIIAFAIAAAGLVFFFMLVWGGMKYSLARGDEKAVQDARKALTNAIVGLLIIVAAFIIINLVSLVGTGGFAFP